MFGRIFISSTQLYRQDIGIVNIFKKGLLASVSGIGYNEKNDLGVIMDKKKKIMRITIIVPAAVTNLASFRMKAHTIKIMMPSTTKPIFYEMQKRILRQNQNTKAATTSEGIPTTAAASVPMSWLLRYGTQAMISETPSQTIVRNIRKNTGTMLPISTSTSAASPISRFSSPLTHCPSPPIPM